MTMSKLEHLNITVSNPQRSADLLIALFGWKIRWQGPSRMGGETIHVGSDDQYLALYSHAAAATADADFRKGEPLNHIGVIVDDLDEAASKVRAAGLEPGEFEEYDPGRRFYFFDWDGIEYEVVNY